MLPRFWMFSPGSFKEAIGTSQCFMTHIHDIRRRPRPTFMDARHQLTAVRFSSCMLPGQKKIPADRCCLPVVVPVKMEAVDDDDDKEAVLAGKEEAERALGAISAAGSEEIGISAKEVAGWATSYRASQPEKRTFKDWRRRWTRARARWTGIALQSVRVRRPQHEQLVKQKEWRARRNKKKL